jgi:two-component system, chemotaxis family, chemotaxis protein CheY
MPSNCRVLIIDNNDSLREGATELLEEHGYQVLSARDGLEGLAMLRSLESGPLPDLILLDLWMPRMDGWQFKTAVKQVPAFAKIPIVVFTADRLSEDVLTIGADDYVVKPPDVEALLSTIARFCNKRPAATASE